MSEIVGIRVGDRAPFLAYRFPFPLTDAISVTFSARVEPSKVVFIDRQPAQIANGVYWIDGEQVTLTPADANAVAFYPWAAPDTAVVRKSASFLFHVNRAGGIGETLPSEGGHLLRIWESY